jgi:hypothetical protein
MARRNFRTVEQLRKLLSNRGVFYSMASSAVARRCLRIADGLNTITLRGGIGSIFPVFGFRPIRGPLLRTTKEPNKDSFTVSPFSRRSVISLNTSSTNVADSDRDKPTLLWTASHKSARVTAFLDVRTARLFP